MANNLTGDFDVVAEFAVLAVDRLLAAMHQTGRFLHSISARVDDNPHPTRPGWPTFVGVVDSFGGAIANQRQVGTPNPFPGPSAASDAIYSRLGTLLNPDQMVATAGPVVPSHISGTVQLQIFPPTVVVPDASGTNLTVRMNVMARFFPDKDTAPLAQFVRGNLSITAPINKIVSGGVRVIDIDFRAGAAAINFTPSYSSQSLSTEDLVGINLCIQNALQTSFLPSSVTLPPSIADAQLKTLPGVIAVLLDLNDHPSNPSSVTNVFLAGSDDFAFAVGREYLLNTMRLISDNILSQPIPPVTFSVDLEIWGVGTILHYSYAIQLHTAIFDLQSGKIVLTITGHAGPAQHPPSDFNFTITVDFSLLPEGNTVELQMGNISVSTDSTLAGIVDFFTGDITNSVRDAVSAAISATSATSMVHTMFNADTNLGNFLNAQLNPADSSAQFQSQQVFLVYDSVNIETAGIVLHGSLLVFDWPAPYVEFEPVPPNTAVQSVVGSTAVRGTDYSALKTWIPGGTIAQYAWSVQGQEQAYPFDVDPNRFVLLHSGQPVAEAASALALPGYAPLCLTITGNRISNYGSPPAYQTVTASVCGYLRFPVALGAVLSNAGTIAPMLAVTRPNPSGGIIVSGQTSVAIDRTGAAAPNLIVHFADFKSSSQLQLLTQALARSNREDAPTAVIAVLTPDQLSKAPFTPGIVYAEDLDGRWQIALGLKSSKRPLTAVVAPGGDVAWQGEGALEVETLAAVLTRHLVKRAPIRLSLPLLNLRIGQPAPNFLFEYFSGRQMPLTKLKGQPLILIFWSSTVKSSIQAVRDLQASSAKSWAAGPSALKKSRAPIVLAVNDGDDPEVARRVAAENGLTAILVTDPKREIALAYGVTLWPTIVSLDSTCTVAGIRYGYIPDGSLTSPSNPAGRN
jgi:peroxiredoxin